MNGTVIAAAGVATPYFFARNAWGADFVNNPGSAKTVVLGLNVPQTGEYVDEGAEELRAYSLAIKHLNGEGDSGMLKTLMPLSLKGNGILGKKVEYAIGDTKNKSDVARTSAARLIKNNRALMITGGVSDGVAVGVQSLCHESGVIFMAGLDHSNDTTGADKRRYGFRHFLNAYMSGAALGPVLKTEMGTARRAYHLTTDNTWGWSQEVAIKNTTEALGWQTVNTVRTPVGTADFTRYLIPVLYSGADVLILNHYDRDMINSLTKAVESGLRDQQVNGKPFEIIVPFISPSMAKGAGDNIKGILGTANWNWALQDAGSQAFVKSFGQEFGYPPSQTAHTCYVQTLLYANACEIAGTFYPPEVIKALEGFRFDGMGNGSTLYRAEDHQCFKDVLVVRGNENPNSQFDLVEIVETVSRSEIEYDSGIFGGELGRYKI